MPDAWLPNQEYCIYYRNLKCRGENEGCYEAEWKKNLHSHGVSTKRKIHKHNLLHEKNKVEKITTKHIFRRSMVFFKCSHYALYFIPSSNLVHCYLDMIFDTHFKFLLYFILQWINDIRNARMVHIVISITVRAEIIEKTISLVLGLSAVMYILFILKHCTLTNKAWLALSKPPHRWQAFKLCPLWLLFGTPSALGP